MQFYYLCKVSFFYLQFHYFGKYTFCSATYGHAVGYRCGIVGVLTQGIQMGVGHPIGENNLINLVDLH